MIKKDVFWKEIKEFLRANFTLKLTYMRLVFFTIALIVVLIPSITMNIWSQNQTDSYPLGNVNAFWHVHIVVNSGMGFSLLENNIAAVYSIQIILNLLILIAILFSKKWYYVFLLALAFSGGCFNVLDRAIPKVVYSINNAWQYNVVMDYFEFNFNWGIFNFPDMFILIGLIGFAILYFVMSIINLKSDQAKSRKESSSGN